MTTMADRRLRGGIVGGGRGAFIGSIHRIAAELDGQASIIAGSEYFCLLEQFVNLLYEKVQPSGSR